MKSARSAVLFACALGLVALAPTLAALRARAAVAQAQATSQPTPGKDQEKFTLDLPEWNPAPEDLPPELRPLDVVRPVLPEDAAKEVAELEEKMRVRKELAKTREQQDAALDEAISLAQRVLEIRTTFQGNTADVVRWSDANGDPATWHELSTTLQRVEHMHLLKGLEAEARTELASLDGTDEEFKTLKERGKYAEALALLDHQLEIRSRVLGDDNPFTLATVNNVGVLLQDEGRLTDAEPYLRESLEGLLRVLSDDEHPVTLYLMFNLGRLLLDEGRLADAEPYLRKSLEGRRRVLGDEHPETQLSINYLGTLLQQQGCLAEAEPYLRKSLEGQRQALGDDHPDTLASVNNLGAHFLYEGRPAEAEPYLRVALEGRRLVFGDEHRATVVSIINMGALRRSQGRLAEAELYYSEALKNGRCVLGDDHASTLASISGLAVLLASGGRLVDAEPYLQESLEGRQRVLGSDHMDTLDSIDDMGALLQRQGRLTEAEPYYRDALDGRLRVLGAEHPDTLLSISNLGGLFLEQGRLDEAEPYLRDALEGRRRLLGAKHPDTLLSLNDVGSVLRESGEPAEAELYFLEALTIADGLRVDVIGGPLERALASGVLNIPRTAAGYARTLVALGRASDALSVLERGCSRAGLDLMAGGSAEAERLLRASGDSGALARYDAALEEEQSAKLVVFEAEARMSNAPEQEKPAWRERIKVARMTLSEKTAAVFQELRGLLPVGEPASIEEVLASLGAGEAVLSYSWTDDGAIALVARGGEVRAVTLAKDRNDAAKRADALKALRGRIAFRPSAGEQVPPPVLTAARAAAVPEELRKLLDGVTALTVIADGPLAGVPLETLLPETPVVYAPSATIAIRCRKTVAERATRTASAVVLGDPVFAMGEREEPDYPETGVLLEVVQEGSIAARAGLRRGDVLLGYGDHELFSGRDLATAVGDTAGVGDEQVPTLVWRAGEELEVSLAHGPMGVVTAKAPAAEALRTMAVLDRAAASADAEATALEQVRLYGGALERLPSTRVEGEAVAALFGGDATLLLGSDASVPRLREAIESSRPRVLHLATHGLMGSADRPLLASLALCTPQEPTPDDSGLLTLEEILSTWGAQLRGSELVTLSACDTGRGVQQGDTVMALPLGLFVAGAESVLASLWKVDDRATALLMARFYANWLGRATTAREIDGARYAPGEPLPKLAALREAQEWLRSLTTADRDRLSTSDAGQIVAEASGGTTAPLVREAAAVHHPYEHPFYWAGFVLYGNPR